MLIHKQTKYILVGSILFIIYASRILLTDRGKPERLIIGEIFAKLVIDENFVVKSENFVKFP